MSEKHYHILLVEDHRSDVLLTRKAFERLTTPTTIHVAVDGYEAMAFLRREGRFTSAPRPDLVLLDLNMPRRDGRSVLKDAKVDPVLRSIPILVLTTSGASHDVQLAYQLSANVYLVKPVTFEEFLRLVEAIDVFWLRRARLPGSSP